MQDFAQTIWEAILPVISLIWGVVVAPVIVAVSVKWFQKLGVDISATQRDTYQSALLNAAGVLIQRLGPRAATLTNLAGQLGNPDVLHAIERVEKGAPDGVKKWGLTPTDIAKGIEAKLGVLTGPTDAKGAPLAAVEAKPGPVGMETIGTKPMGF
jgi:hypothetical protein